MFHQQNTFSTSPLHVPMPMEAMTHSPNQMEQISPHNPSNMGQDNNSDPFTEVINISKIKDGFFIGDKLAAISIDVIIQFKITHFINATGSQIMNQWESLGINYLTINWSENERQILFDGRDEIAERIVQFIDSSFIVGEGLLAHSYKGQNRVCLVVLIYLMKKYKWSLNKSLDYLKSKKNDVDIAPYFYVQLIRFEERLKQRGEIENDIPWPSTFLLKDVEEKLICNTYINGLPSQKDNLDNNNTNKNTELNRHIIWNDENPVQKGPLEIVDREHDLFLENDIKPVTSHQRIRPTKKSIKNVGNNKQNKYNVYDNNINMNKNEVGVMNNYIKNDNTPYNNNINNINNFNNNMNNNTNNNMNNQINNDNNNLSNKLKSFNLNSMNPQNRDNFEAINDNDNFNSKKVDNNDINPNLNKNDIEQANNNINNQINTNTSINMKKPSTQIHNNNFNNKGKRSTSNKKNDKANNNLSNSSKNFANNKMTNNMGSNIPGRPLNNSMNDFIEKRNKLNNIENINNNLSTNLNNEFNRHLAEDIYGSNFDYIKHGSNTFLSNNNYNNRNINNNKINKPSYGINYNNNNIHNNTYNNISKNKPLNNFNPNLIKKKNVPPTGHGILNRNKSNVEEGPIKIKKNNYLKNLNNNLTNYNYKSNKKPTTPDLNHYNVQGFTSENIHNTNHSMTKTNSSSILGTRTNQKNDLSSGIFGYGTKINFKNKFGNNTIKRPSTAPHKDKVKVPSGVLGAINKKTYGINKKPKIGKFNPRPQSAEGKNKNMHKNYNSSNNYMNKNMSNSNVIGEMNKKFRINNIKNNIQNKRINSPMNAGNTNINNKNLFNGSKYNNPKYRMPSPMIKTTNIQKKSGI